MDIEARFTTLSTQIPKTKACCSCFFKNYVEIRRDAQGNIQDLRWRRLNLFQRLFRKAFGLYKSTHLKSVMEPLSGKVAQSHCDQEGLKLISQLIGKYKGTFSFKSDPAAGELSFPPKSHSKLSEEEENQVVGYYKALKAEGLPTNDFIKYGASLDGFTLPRSLLFIDGTPILLLNRKGGLKKVGSGHRGLVKRAVDLSSGKLLVKKSCSKDEKALYRKVAGKTGIVKVFGFYQRGAKSRVLQPEYTRTLYSQLWKKEEEFNDAVRYQALKELWAGLSTLHELTIGDMPFFHGDLKGTNVFCKKTRDFVIDDFDVSALTPDSVGGTPGWYAPEAVLFRNGVRQGGEHSREFNKRTGQARDVWTMGLISAAILLGRIEAKDLCPLKSIYSRVDLSKEGKERDVGLLGLKQKELDQEIDEIIASRPQDKEWQAHWAFVKRALRILPDQRPKASEFNVG